MPPMINKQRRPGLQLQHVIPAGICETALPGHRQTSFERFLQMGRGSRRAFRWALSPPGRQPGMIPLCCPGKQAQGRWLDAKKHRAGSEREIPHSRRAPDRPWTQSGCNPERESILVRTTPNVSVSTGRRPFPHSQMESETNIPAQGPVSLFASFCSLTLRRPLFYPTSSRQDRKRHASLLTSRNECNVGRDSSICLSPAWWSKTGRCLPS
jgi:hypothetical protein